MNVLRAFLVAVLIAVQPAWGKSPPEPASASHAAPPPASDAPKQEMTQEYSLDFELLDTRVDAAEARLDPELEAMVARRRTMLQVHQGLGLGMAAGLVATTVVGQLSLNEHTRGGDDKGSYRLVHRGLVIGTSALFTSVGLMGLLSPEPYEKKGLQLDTTTVHKLFMSLATAGMLTQVVLGLVLRRQESQVSKANLAAAHQVAGYATVGAVSAGVITLVF